MVDFDVWGAAVSHALGYDPNIFLRSRVQVHSDWSYTDNKWAHIAEVIKRFAHSNPNWEGTMSQLYNEISELKDNRASWPRNATGLGKIRSKVNTMLSEKGIQVVEFKRKFHENIFKFEIEKYNTESSYCKILVHTSTNNVEDEEKYLDNCKLLGLAEIKDTNLDDEADVTKNSILERFKTALKFLHTRNIANQ